MGGDAFDARWQAMLEQAWRHIRTRAPHLTLILTGGRGGDIDGLLALDPRAFLKDPATVFTFHYYEPFIFSHQALPGNQQYRFLSNVPYPAGVVSVLDTMDNAASAIAKSPLSAGEKLQELQLSARRLTAYYRTGFSARDTAQKFDQVSAWARKHGIAGRRILLGEFGVVRDHGVYHGAADADRARWLGDVRKAAEERGFGWSLWTYRGSGGMAVIVSDDNPAIEPVTVSALGLRRPR